MRAWLFLCLITGCAASQKRAVDEVLQAQLARAEQLDAAALSPQLYQRYRAEHDKARTAQPASPAESDHNTAARLWLSAAMADAERVQLARARLEIEREAVRSDERFLASEEERIAADRALERRAAGAIAKQEAERSLARAALLPAQRTKLAREEVERAARLLLTRAELIALALPTGADKEAREELHKLITEARAALPKTPDRALSLADQALFSALSLVARLRDAEGAPTKQQTTSLVEALQLSGAVVRRDDAGLTASIKTKAGGERAAARLCSVALAYPRGSVRVASAAGGTLLASLARAGCRGERFELAKPSPQGALELTFFAY